MRPEGRPERARAGAPWRAPEESSWLVAAALWSVERARGPLRALRLDPALFRELLRVRLLLALRPARAGASAWGTAGIALAVVMTWLAGLGTGLIALVGGDAQAWVAVSQSALFFLLAWMLFQHFAGVLVDPTDIGVVAPHPVDDRTLFGARLAEILAYLLVFVASFTAGNVLLAVFAAPPLAVLLVYPLLSLLCGVTALGLVALLFALCLRLVGPTHFQRVTLWTQILAGTLLFAGMQVPRMVHPEQWMLWLEELRGLRFLWPPFQYAEAFALSCGRPASLAPIAAAALVPLAALVLTLWLASRYFVAGLQGTLGAPVPRSGWEGGLVARALAELGVRKREQRAGFDFALALSRREPHFLRGVLPQMAMFQIMAFGAGFGLRRDVKLFLPMTAGLLLLALPSVLLQAQGTAVPEARALFRSAPIADEAELLRGSVKALLLQWIGVPALVLLALQLVAVGPEALPRIVLAFELAFVAVLLFTRAFQLGLPFTQAVRFGGTGAANLGIILVMGLALALLVAVHLLLARHAVTLSLGIAVLAAILAWQWRALDRLRPAAERGPRG